MSGSDRLATLARVAALREDRAKRAWAAATEERDRRAATEAAAERVRQLAASRADAARDVAMTDPCSDQAWVWTAATRALSDEARATKVQATRALDDAAQAATFARVDHTRSVSRRSTIDDRLARTRAAERRVREDKEADDMPIGTRGSLTRESAT